MNNNFDVVFLLLSRASSRRFDLLWNLYDALTAAGFHTALATHPDELRAPSKRLRIVVIDGNVDIGDFDSLQVTRDLHCLKQPSQYIVFVGNNSSDMLRQGRQAGADVCISETIQEQQFCHVVQRLVLWHEQAQTSLLTGQIPITALINLDDSLSTSVPDYANTRRQKKRRNAFEAYRLRVRSKERMQKHRKTFSKE